MIRLTSDATFLGCRQGKSLGTRIENIKAVGILGSRGSRTVRVTATLNSGIIASENLMVENPPQCG
jgi:hypothetical protein